MAANDLKEAIPEDFEAVGPSLDTLDRLDGVYDVIEKNANIDADKLDPKVQEQIKDDFSYVARSLYLKSPLWSMTFAPALSRSGTIFADTPWGRAVMTRSESLATSSKGRSSQITSTIPLNSG